MKKGIQLSMNFLVTIIIAIVILVLGILVLRQFIGGAEELKTDLDERTEAQLSNLLSAGQQVAVTFNTQTIKRGKSHLFGLGILNIGDDPPNSFEISLTFKNTDAPAPYGDPGDWTRYNSESFSIERSEQHSEPVLIQVADDAPSGTYIFDVAVTKNGQLYDTIKKIYITVP